jgi:hypothetical protein
MLIAGLQSLPMERIVFNNERTWREKIMQMDASYTKTLIENVESVQWIKNEMAIRLITDWMADQSGYDEAIWNHLKESIENNRLSERKRFDE